MFYSNDLKYYKELKNKKYKRVIIRIVTIQKMKAKIAVLLATKYRAEGINYLRKYCDNRVFKKPKKLRYFQWKEVTNG